MFSEAVVVATDQAAEQMSLLTYPKNTMLLTREK